MSEAKGMQVEASSTSWPRHGSEHFERTTSAAHHRHRRMGPVEAAVSALLSLGERLILAPVVVPYGGADGGRVARHTVEDRVDRAGGIGRGLNSPRSAIARLRQRMGARRVGGEPDGGAS